MGGGCGAPPEAVQAPKWVDFPAAAQVLQVQRTRTIKGRKHVEVAYLICSLPMEQAQPEQVAAWVQGHWGIENRLHWIRNVVFDEDRHQLRTRNGPEIMAALRNLTTRHHPSGPRRPSRYRLHHQIPVTTTKTRHQAHHPTNHLTRLCRPPAYGTALATSRSRAIGIYTGQSVTGRLHMRKAVSKSSHVDKVRLF